MNHISAAQTEGSVTFGKDDASRGAVPFPNPKAKRDETATMRALVWNGNKSVELAQVPRVTLTDPGDAIVRVTATTVCGSDLHLYHSEIPGLHKGDIIGHEAIGIVEQVGPQVTSFKAGDRVVISAVISCGKCAYCADGMMSMCDSVNSSVKGRATYGVRMGALFGYTDVMGGYDGVQAELARVPLADVNLLKLAPSIPDELGVLLADVLPTSFHANELGEVGPGDNVVIFGCGPIGLLCAMWARFRGAARIISIDAVPERLALARDRVGAEVLNYAQTDVVKALADMLPGGADVCIEAAGFRFPKSLMHTVQRTLRLETDSPQVVNEAMMVAKKGGRVVLIGDYLMFANGFGVGILMEKGLRVTGGQLWCQKYWSQIQDWLLAKRVDPSFVVTHVLPFTDMARAYTMFDQHQDGAVKMILKTQPDAGAVLGKVSLSTGPAVLQPLPGANMGNGRPLKGAISGAAGGASGGSAAGFSGGSLGQQQLKQPLLGGGATTTTGSGVNSANSLTAELAELTTGGTGKKLGAALERAVGGAPSAGSGTTTTTTSSTTTRMGV